MSHVCHSLPTHLREDILVATKFWWLWMNYGHLCTGLFSFIRITFNSLDKCRGIQFLNNRGRFCFVRICPSVFCSGRTILPASASSAFMLLVVHPDAIQCNLTVVLCAVPSGQVLLVKFSCSFFFFCHLFLYFAKVCVQVFALLFSLIGCFGVLMFCIFLHSYSVSDISLEKSICCSVAYVLILSFSLASEGFGGGGGDRVLLYWLAWNLPCKSDGPSNHRDPPAFASQTLGL